MSGGRLQMKLIYGLEDLCFDSYIIPTNDLKPGELRLLEVDNRVVLPIELPIRIFVASVSLVPYGFNG